MDFGLAHLCLILILGFASGFVNSQTSVQTSALSTPTSISGLNLSLADYYTGQQFVPPQYLNNFSLHLNDLEIEYLEFFKQLQPVNEAAVVVSSCLTAGGSNKLIIKRGPFGKFVRKLKGFLNHIKKQILIEPPARPIFGGFCAATSLTINVYYHVVSSSDGNFKYVTETMIKEQTNYLNKYYGRLNINFVTQDLAYRIDTDFATSQYNPDHPHRKFSRSGTYADLNVWITERIPGDKPGESTIGYATFPDATKSAEQRSYDGVVVVYWTLPAGPGGDGSNLVHEVGHWLGLRHVFDESQEDAEQCVPTPDTDSVQDTYQFPAHRPEVFRDMQIACGDTIPISQYNFMSYSGIKGNDGFGFTTGQKARIFARYLGARRGIKNQMGCVTTPLHTKRSGDTELPLPDNIIDAIKEDDKTCAKDLADARARPDISLDSSPDPLYPEYPEMPIEPSQRKADSPIDPLAPPSPGSSIYLERCTTERLPFLKFPRIGTYGADGKCTCPTSSTPGEILPLVVDGSGCPAVCNPHSNSCHVHSAQNCVFPAPFVSTNPRSYCACRPGYKSVYGTDTTKHWRVSTLGIQNFVWVAEGVVCDTPCKDVMCSEVPVLPKPCV